MRPVLAGLAGEFGVVGGPTEGGTGAAADRVASATVGLLAGSLGGLWGALRESGIRWDALGLGGGSPVSRRVPGRPFHARF